MSDIPSVRQKIQIEGTRLRSPTSESLFQTIGATENYLIDERDVMTANIATNASNIASLTTEIGGKPTITPYGRTTYVISGSFANILTTPDTLVAAFVQVYSIAGGSTNYVSGSALVVGVDLVDVINNNAPTGPVVGGMQLRFRRLTNALQVARVGGSGTVFDASIVLFTTQP